MTSPVVKRATVGLYRILDASTLGGLDEATLRERMRLIAANEPEKTEVVRHWIVGRFDDDATRQMCTELLDELGLRWIDAGDGARDCRISPTGAFVPDPKLFGFVDVHAEQSQAWLLLWPWDSALPMQAERDLLTDIARLNSDSVHRAFLRQGAPEAQGTQEPDFAWRGTTLPVWPRELVAERAVRATEEPGSRGRRAGWALEATSLDKLKAPERESDDTPTFHFGICLRARDCSRDWSVTCSNLERTLENLSRQRSGAFRVWIAVHELPDVRTFGLDVEYVIVDFDPPVGPDGKFGNDKGRKRKILGRTLKARVKEGFYYMQLDADDLLDISLVQAVLADDNRRGYRIESGYIFDFEQRVAARCNADTVPFWRQCGSSAVLYMEPADLAEDGEGESYFEQQRRHEQFAIVAEQRGRPLASWSDDMALYLVNHGENHWSTYRYEAGSRADSKSKFVHRHRLVAPAEIDMLSLRYPELVDETGDVKESDREMMTS